jgi:hypothetical protein
MTELKAGTRIKSAVCATELMVIQAPAGDVDVRCGGALLCTKPGEGTLALGSEPLVLKEAKPLPASD